MTDPMHSPRAALALAALLAVAPAPAPAAPCAGFVDVDSASPFCPTVEWIRNRKVTLGCTTGAYCPNDAVSRLQMAAFMNRLGTALTPVVLKVETASGALALDNLPVVCQTPDQAIADFPRRAQVDAALAGTGPVGVDVGVRAVYSTDGGASWQPLSAVQPAGYVAPSRWSQVTDVGVLDLDVGTTLRFGVQATRIGAGTANLADSRCHLRASIASRDGTASPL